MVGYFILGPSDLYKVTKEIGKFIQNFRSFSADATATFENSLESQLQLDEIRKAQRELNDAFSFRRSINVDADSEAFEVNAKSPRAEMPEPLAASMANETGAVKKKVRRRRVKKQTVEEEQPFSMESVDNSNITPNVPDLEMDDLMDSEERMMASLAEANEELRNEQMEDEATQLRRERMERLQGGSPESRMAEEEMAAGGYDMSAMSDDAAQNRFQSQLSANWNAQILAKEGELGPVAEIMKRLAVLEEEKIAADKRLQEEFKRREENEEKFYREKRKLLEEAVAQIQSDAYATTGPSANSTQQQ